MKRALSALAAIALALAAISSASAKTVPQPIGCQTGHHTGSLFGDGTGTDAHPVKTFAAISIPDPNPLACVIQVGTSNSDQYFLMGDGTLWAWGQDAYGELGNGTSGTGVNNFTSAATQVQFPPGVSIAFIPTDAMPYDTGLAVDSGGNLWGWGLNRGGELCTGDKAEHDLPVELTAWPAPVTEVAGADQHIVAETSAGLESGGADTDGVLGNGSAQGGVTSPVPVVTIGSSPVVAVTSSYDDAGAVLADGSVWTWGDNASGMIGNGKTRSVDAPFRVPLPLPVAQFAQGGSDAQNGQALALLTDGSLYAWGNDQWAQLGDGGIANELSPEQITLPAGVTFTSVASGGQTSYGLTSSGAVYGWGDNSHWQLGGVGSQVVPVPVQVDSGAAWVSSTAYNVAVG